jgi:peptidoglycan/xylan/chitin deacetylase (PgdA/CDA1 family)
MHDIYTATSNSLEIIIPKLLEKGYQLVTIEELFYYKQIELENSKVYYNAK